MVVDPITGSAATMLAQKIQLVSRPTFTYHASVPMLVIPSTPQCNPEISETTVDRCEDLMSPESVEAKAQRGGPEHVDVEIRLLEFVDASPLFGKRSRVVSGAVVTIGARGLTPRQLREWRAEHTTTERTNAHAVVDIPERSLKPLVETPCLLEDLTPGHQARARSGAHLLDDVQVLIDAARQPEPSADDSLVRNGPVGVAESDADGSDVRALAQLEHDVDPLRGDHAR